MTRDTPNSGQSEATGFSAASILSMVFLSLALTAGFAAFLTASDPGLAIAKAETDARSALDRYGYNWARIRITNGSAVITGTAPTEAERVIAYQAVRGALRAAMLEDDIVRDIRSRIDLAESIPPPSAKPVRVADAGQATPPSAPIPTMPMLSPDAKTQVFAEVQIRQPVEIAAVPAPAKTGQIETSAISKPSSLDAASCKSEFASALSANKIAFGIDSAKIEKSSDPVLDTLSGIARRCAKYRLTVEGHTDQTGRTAHNHDLSQKRAESVRAALISRGLSKEKIGARGYGAAKPIANGATEAAYALNRRIEITVSDAAAATPSAKPTAKSWQPVN